MDSNEYIEFLENTNDTLNQLTDCCKSTSDLLKLLELKMQIAKELYLFRQYYA
jgi:hypothetical protein